MIRRDFFKYSILSATALTTLNANEKESKDNIEKPIKKTQVAICGGGFAGLSTAKRLKALNPNLDVTIIEKNNSFSSCPFSNLWLGGIEDITYEDLNFDYNSAIEKYKYNFLNETIVDINKDKKLITTNNSELQYDYLVLALGIDYDYSHIFGDDKEKAKECALKAPAGLKPGNEHLKLKRMIQNFKGGNFVILVPSFTYKCPPAPYERACMIASYFKENKIDGKVVVLDPREKPLAKPDKFLKAYKKYYSDFIEYIPNAKFKDIDFKEKTIKAEVFNEEELEEELKTFEFEEASIMPKNKAHSLIEEIGIELTSDGWAKLNNPSFRTFSNPEIYVVGDAQGGYPYPKSAQMANTCGYIVAEEIINTIKGLPYDYTKNLPGNICYSMVTPKLATSVNHSYTYSNKVDLEVYVSDIDKYAVSAAYGWYFGLMEDVLGIES